ncbi:hypothetical protein MLD38_027702 [Melastoma candidum]|nr:hypothetical protein MLD38_027702 [Melastoma candidum]
MAEDGVLGKLLDGIPKRKSGDSLICDGCGNVRFVPCFRCNGSCKVASAAAAGGVGKTVVVTRCGDCNENGLVLCPLCS